MHLTITVNFPDGTEHNDIELYCADLAAMPSVIGGKLLSLGYVTYSSLVIVAVPTAMVAEEQAAA